MNQFECEKCGIKDALVFHCNYCGGYFCAEHHLPESHNCPRIPKITPFHVRPSEVESYEASVEPQPSYKPQEPSAISYPSANQHSKTKHWKKIAGAFAILIIVGLLLWAAYPSIQQAIKNPSKLSQTPTPAPTFTIPNITSSTPAPITTPASTTPYVEVDYQTVGWFYSNSGDSLSDIVTITHILY